MASKKSKSALKSGRSSRARPASSAGKASKKLATIQSLRLAAKRDELRLKRAGKAYIEKATELEFVRRQQRESARQLAAVYGGASLENRKPFYNFLAQGDSWFSYTCGFAMIHWLEQLFTVERAYFDNIAASGRTLRQMISKEFKAELEAGPPNGQPWTAVLMSGGGNDICGEHRFKDWLRPYDGPKTPGSYITPAFDDELKVLTGYYEEAISLVAKVSPGIRIFVHAYDFAIPDGRCVAGRSPRLESTSHFCFAGPWMLPAFEQRGFPCEGNSISQLSKDIVVAILKRFASALHDLEMKYPNQFVLVTTQNTLQPIQSKPLWDNELHPVDQSFKRLAKPFFDTLNKFL